MPQQHNPGRHVQSLTLPQSRHNHRNTSAYIFPTVPTPRTTPPAPGPNAPTQFASAIQDTSPPPHAAPLRPDSSDHLTSADPQCSTSPPRLTRAIQDTPLPPNTDPTSSRHLGPPPTPGHASPPGTAPPLRRSPMLQLPVATLPPHSRHTPAAAQRFHRPDASDNPADTGTRHAPGTASPHRRDPTLQHSAATRQRHSRHFPTAAQRPPHHPDASNHPADTGTRPAPGTKKSGSASRTYSFVSNFSIKNRRLHLAQTNALTQHNQSGAYPLINPCSHN